MDAIHAQEFANRERARWFNVGSKHSDDELLRRREQLFNGITLFLGVAIMPSIFFASGLGYFVLVGEVLAARKCSVIANRCRDSRQILRSQLQQTSAEHVVGGNGG